MSDSNVPPTAAPMSDAGAVDGPPERVTEPATEMDLRMHDRPIPVAIVIRVLRSMQPGQLLRVITKADGTHDDFGLLTKINSQYEVTAFEQLQDGAEVHVLRRKAE